MSYSTFYEDLKFESTDCSSLCAKQIIKYCVNRDTELLVDYMKDCNDKPSPNGYCGDRTISMTLLNAAFLYECIEFTPIKMARIRETKLCLIIKRKNHLGDTIRTTIDITFDIKLNKILLALDYLKIKNMYVSNLTIDHFILPDCVKKLWLINNWIKHIETTKSKLQKLFFEYGFTFESETILTNFIRGLNKLTTLSIHLLNNTDNPLLKYLINNNTITTLEFNFSCHNEPTLELISQLLKNNKTIQKLYIEYLTKNNATIQKLYIEYGKKYNLFFPLELNTISSNFKKIHLNIDVSANSIKQIITHSMNTVGDYWVNSRISIDELLELVKKYPTNQVISNVVHRFLLKQPEEDYTNLSECEFNKWNSLIQQFYNNDYKIMYRKFLKNNNKSN